MRLSVITVALNSAAHIRRAVESVIAQDFASLEYLVIDGKSTDDTVAIVEGYRNALPRLEVLSERDNGLYDAMNKGIRLATGEIIGILNSDDSYFPGALAAVHQVFAAEPSADIVYGDVITVYTADESARTRPDASRLREAMTIDHPGCFVRREVFDRFGGFDTRYRIAADYDFLLRCYLGGARFVRLPQPIARFEHGGASARHAATGRREVFQIQSRQIGLAWALRRRVRRDLARTLSSARRTVGSTLLGSERFERIAKRWRQKRAEGR